MRLLSQADRGVVSSALRTPPHVTVWRFQIRHKRQAADIERSWQAVEKSESERQSATRPLPDPRNV